MLVGQCVRLINTSGGANTGRCLGIKRENKIGKILSNHEGIVTVEYNKKKSNYFSDEIEVVPCLEAVASPAQILINKLTAKKTEVETFLSYIESNVTSALVRQKTVFMVQTQTVAGPAKAKKIRGQLTEIESLLTPLLLSIGSARDNTKDNDE